jgi:hypothetical protein
VRLDPIRLGPLVKLTRGRPGLPRHRLAFLPDTGRLVSLFTFRILRAGRSPPPLLRVLFEAYDDGRALVSRARFACRLIDDPPWPPERDQFDRHLIGWDHPPGVPFEALRRGRGALPMEIATGVVRGLLEALAVWRMTGVSNDPRRFRPIVGWDGVVRIFPRAALFWQPEVNEPVPVAVDNGRYVRQLFTALYPDARRVFAGVEPRSEDELSAFFAHGGPAAPEDIASFLEHMFPDEHARSLELLEQTEMLTRDMGRWAKTRVHPLPVGEGYETFIERAWRA